jgi:hypothetical protein
VTGYSYESFDAYVESGEDEREFGAFPNMLHAGKRALDGELTLLDCGRVRLSELWRGTKRAARGQRVRASRADLGRTGTRSPSLLSSAS